MNGVLLWAVLAAMTLAVTAALVVPLLRLRPPRGRRADFNRQVYRDQLGELDADVERGVVTAAEAEAARVEIQRRLIATVEGDGEAPPAAGAPRAAAVAVAVAVLVPAAALSVYLWLGSPGAPAAPGPPRAAGAEAAREAQELDANIEKLRARLARQGGDLQGWLLLARSLTVLGRHGEAVAAYRRAAAIDPGNLDVKAAAAEALVAASDGRVTPEARTGFREVLAARPGDPAAPYNLAQAGELDDAFDMWRSLLLDAPADAPWREPVAQRVRELAARLGVDGTAAPRPEDGGERRGPTAEDMAAAADMSPEERRRMIRGMVEDLAARLEGQPDDAQGWRRLVRVYGVLGERREAYAAMARAVARLPDDAGALLGAAGALMEARRPGDPVPQAAVTALRRVLDIEPENPDALFYMGEVQAEAGAIEQARATWLGLLRRLDPGSPSHATVKRALERLESGG
ncbi:MAG: c-type cytochrome biogenesis protein CcmI [Alphaproteobacteria bacterium]|nr:c-type cytochrome biogenesis protein CcmI [Alphaproteobacteria bacterium]